MSNLNDSQGALLVHSGLLSSRSCTISSDSGLERSKGCYHFQVYKNNLGCVHLNKVSRFCFK